MIEKIVLIADIHFRTYKRHLEFRAISEAFFAHMAKLRPNRIVIAGDLVHSRNHLTPELVNEVAWFLTNLSGYTEKVIIIPGNHDIVEQNKERMDAITPILTALKAKENEVTPHNIYYSKKSELVEDGNVVWSIFNIYDNHKMPDNLPLKPYGRDKTYIGLYHGTIVGAKNNLGFEFKHGADLKTFDACDITLCGDIHKRQTFLTETNKPVVMVGSFIQQDHAESVSSHGYCVIDVPSCKYSFVDLENPVKFYRFRINDIEDIYESREILENP
jgi:DNA repair exonuclease SbcCD nuclease subunit